MYRDTIKESTAPLKPEHAYLKNDVEAADPVDLLLKLYNKLVVELNRARDGLLDETGGNPGYAPGAEDEAFKKARDILSYLTGTVNSEAGQVAGQLLNMYYYFLQKVLTAQLEKDGRHIDDILPNIETIRQGWAQLADGERNG